MTNTKLFLLIGTSLSFIPILSYAQCVATQDCATLGYTETSCNGGKGVKCPFGNKWACLASKEDVCREEGFTESCNSTGQIGGGDACGDLYKKCACESTYQYTCTGTGYAGGSGPTCNGKYSACTCTDGYKWKDGTCQEPFSGAQGNLYYCQDAVVGIKTSDMNFYIALNHLGQMDWYKGQEKCNNYVFCNNLKGTFPSPDQLNTIYNNKSSLNNLITTYGGKKLSGEYWSSQKQYYHGSNGYTYIFYILNMTDGSSSSPRGVNSTDPGQLRSNKVLPILTSW